MFGNSGWTIFFDLYRNMSTAPFPRGGAVAAERGTFQVNQFTRTHDDACDVSQQLRDSAGPGKYVTTNMTPGLAGASSVSIATPTMLMRDGYGFTGARIDDDSRIRNEKIQAGRQRCPLHVQARPFATVPYMGNGRGNPDVESALLYSEFARVERPCGTVSETFLEGQFTPLVPHLASHIQNPANLIPEVANKGFMRGGLPTRQYMEHLNM